MNWRMHKQSELWIRAQLLEGLAKSLQEATSASDQVNDSSTWRT